ncbi:MAG: 30S ribosomal protein S27e [Candidatus Heimdallarchaeota archaeon AB_125]|nr:MAG: 30S ribosomal protein S27e [Candidatus Heimdallarchaeota archaeon AB_125]
MSKIPYPTTKFLKVKCTSCSNEQVIFDSAKIVVKCNVCEEDLAQPRGGKAKILGEIVEVLS